MTKNTLTLQDYLSFGYLYLLLLGIARESLYYGILGVNIISYSNVLDIMLSPVVYLTKHPIVFLIVFAFVFWIAIQPKLHKKYKDKKWYSKIFNVKQRDEIYSSTNTTLIPKEMPVLALIIASFLLGTGVGSGTKVLDKMEAKELKMTNTLTFMDGVQKEVRILGQNSNYIFYVEKGDRNVSVSPIAGVVKVIEKYIDNEE